jgi:hypothetical protein
MNGLLANPVISGLLSGGPNAIRAAAEQQRLALAPRGGGGMSGAPGAIVTQDRSGADFGAGLAGLGKGLSAIGAMREKSQQEEARRSFVDGFVGVDPEAQKAALAAHGGPTQAAAAAVNAAPNQRLDQLGVPKNLQPYIRDLASKGMHKEAYSILSDFAKPGIAKRVYVERYNEQTGLPEKGLLNTETGEFQLIGGTKRENEPATREREQKIADYMRNFGLSRQDAMRIVDRVEQVHPDPIAGGLNIYNPIGRDTTNVPASMGGAPTAAPTAPGPSAVSDIPAPSGAEGKPPKIWDMAELVAGPGSAITSGAATVAGLAGLDIAPDIQQARQFVQSSQLRLVRALANNPRFPVTEMQNIRREINIEPNFFDSAPALKNRMIAIDQYLRSIVEQERAAGADPSLPVDTRKAALAAVKEIENYANLLGVPQGATAGASDRRQSVPTVTDESSYMAIPPGGLYRDPEGNIRTKRGG